MTRRGGAVLHLCTRRASPKKQVTCLPPDPAGVDLAAYTPLLCQSRRQRMVKCSSYMGHLPLRVHCSTTTPAGIGIGFGPRGAKGGGGNCCFESLAFEWIVKPSIRVARTGSNGPSLGWMGSSRLSETRRTASSSVQHSDGLDDCCRGTGECRFYMRSDHFNHSIIRHFFASRRNDDAQCIPLRLAPALRPQKLPDEGVKEEATSKRVR